MGSSLAATPWMDAEPQVKSISRENTLATVHMFDKSLKAGDWCATAYVSTPTGSYPVAVSWA